MQRQRSSEDISREHLYSLETPNTPAVTPMTNRRNGEMDGIISDFSRFYILTILYEGPAHGYQIISRFKKRVKKDISPSLVYPFLQQLEDKGIVMHKIEPVGQKQRKIFRLTNEGREVCTGLFKRFADLIAITIEPSLYVCAHCGCKVFDGGYREIINGKETAFCCIHCANSYKEIQKQNKKPIKQ